MLNELEVIYLCYYIQNDNHKYDSLKENIFDMPENFSKLLIKNFFQPENKIEMNAFCYYLYLLGYFVKQQFNYDMCIFDDNINKIIPNFRKTYFLWIKQNAQNFDASLIQINAFYNK